MADQYEFLSPQWIEAARRLRDEHPPATAPPEQSVRMNQVITEAPFGEGAVVKVHLDTSSGTVTIEEGHLEDADLTVTVDWVTARSIFVDLDAQAAMQAFMAGKVKVAGDITKLIALQTATPDPSAAELAAKIREITS